MADNVRYVSKEFLDYIKDVYGITSTDKDPALITVDNFQCHAFKNSSGEDIIDVDEVPKDLLVFTERNGFVPQKGKTKKYALNLKLASQWIYNDETEVYEPKKVTELKFNSDTEMKQYVAFSKDEFNSQNISSDLSALVELSKEEANAAKNKMKNREDITTNDDTLKVKVYIESLSQWIKRNFYLCVLQSEKNPSKFYFVCDGASQEVVDKYTFIYFKSTYKGGIEEGSVAITLRASYEALRDIVGKSSESYLFMYLSGNKAHEEFAKKLTEKGSYSSENSYITFKYSVIGSITGNAKAMIRGCFRKTYYNKVVGGNEGNKTLTDFNDSKRKSFIQFLISKIFENNIHDINGKKILNEVNDNEKQEYFKRICCAKYANEAAEWIVETIDGLEKSMSNEYSKAKQGKYYLGKVVGDTKGEKYEELIKENWFLFNDESQAKELHIEFVKRLGERLGALNTDYENKIKDFIFSYKEKENDNEYVWMKDLLSKEELKAEEDDQQNAIEWIGSSRDIKSIKSNLYKIMKEENTNYKKEFEKWWKAAGMDEVVKAVNEKIQSAVEKYIKNYDPNQLTKEELAINNEELEAAKKEAEKEANNEQSNNEQSKSEENKEGSEGEEEINDSFNIYSIKSDLYKIISEKKDSGKAIFIPDVMLQNNRDGNWFSQIGSGRENKYVEKCYLKTGLISKGADKVKFILDVWSPLSAAIEGVGNWLDKGLVDMGSSWVTMLGKGMKSVGNTVKNTAKVAKGTKDFVKNKRKDFKSFGDYIKS